MFKLEDGRTELFQWDLNRRLIISDQSITAVHFCNKTDDCSLVCEVYEEGDARLVNIPNILLQTDWDIRAYAYCGECYTKQAAKFKVNARSKPADYVYTETEVKSWDSLEQRVEALEESGADLSNYYTKEDIDNKGYATEDYVNDAIELDNGVFNESVGVRDGLKLKAETVAVKTKVNGETVIKDVRHDALVDSSGEMLISKSYFANRGLEFGTPNYTGEWTEHKTGIDGIGYWKSGELSPMGTWAPAKYYSLATEDYVNTAIASAMSQLVDGDEVSY